ncbi:hypothetical protein A1O3_04396 [Capronia epimyces CBS 606.96]|uniref:3',5'-cyclic-nucleotide phosphodiesterase n=1 Tax=Capronia epimyces CBS 606.96 TaxID=1182542 RepID=W9YDV8_9EURO|nr:uncharacterized protein A1O3_04396 [Capronia epimyces CBS 606.96]EXJ87436.1 hypothetical protein A1O3_04396 [Capronia epimyces CBS 606.96]
MREQDALRDALPELRVHGKKEGASFQVIVLGSSGGPREDNVTGMLVRAPQTEWSKSSMIAVDAGAHLASIIRILQREMPSSSETIPPKDYARILETGPFAGVKFPNISAKANALYLFREILHAFLITHPHLDHLSSLAINTPALEFGREAKAIVALPSTIEAIKNHIFNDWLWPNLSDEANGVGFVTYRRLIEGGNLRLGLGESRGYVNVCDGLATKCWSLSHGRCQRRSHSISHQHGDSLQWAQPDYNYQSRRLSRISDDHGYFAAVAQQQSQGGGAYPAGSAPLAAAAPMTPGGGPAAPGYMEGTYRFEPVSSSAFFIRNDATGHELLIFGDVEPDSVSMAPRNYIIWEDAAGKIANGTLQAIFIECSYDDSVRNEDLFGHLCPRHLIAELRFLANCVISKRRQSGSESGQATADQAVDSQDVERELGSPPMTGSNMRMKQPPTPSELRRKRKRGLNGELTVTPELAPTHFDSVTSPQALSSGYVGNRASSASRRKRSHERGESHQGSSIAHPPTRARTRSVQFQSDSASSPLLASGGPVPSGAAMSGYPYSTPNPQAQLQTREKLAQPLKGLTVHIIHVKDTLMDGPDPGDVIVGQLRALDEEAGLGAEFNVTRCGDSIWV